MRPYRTVLEQKIRERRQTFEEFAAYVETFAREHNEPGTLSVRHLQRLTAGRQPDGRPLGPVRPATARVLERIFGRSIDELLAPPFHGPAIEDSESELRHRLYVSSQVDKVTLTILQEQLNGIRRLDRQFGAPIARDEVTTKVTQVSRLLTYSLTSAAQEPLAALLSELHCLAGWQALDLGLAKEAWTHYSHAVTSAQISNNPSFITLAIVGQAFVLVDIGQTQNAVDIASSARHTADQKCSHLTRAWLQTLNGWHYGDSGLRSRPV
jgi:hypothetical protein